MLWSPLIFIETSLVFTTNAFGATRHVFAWSSAAGWATTSVWEQSAKPIVRSIYMPAAGCVGGYATNTRSRDRGTNVFRKPLCTRCTVWCSYHSVARAFRGRKRESFPRAGCGKSASPGSMSGNRKQDQAKPDCGDRAKAMSHTHREATVTAPVLDSTPDYAHLPLRRGN